MTPPTMTADNIDAIDDQFMLALVLWREARGELARTGPLAYIAVGCVLRNRSQRDKTSIYEEATNRLQFSSVTAPGDPELILWAKKKDPVDYGAWVLAHQVASGIIAGAYSDPTRGATLYYASSIPFPADWNPAKVKQTVRVGNQLFFAEVA